MQRVLRPGGEARIYDVRFAGYGPGEVVQTAASAGLNAASVRHDFARARIFGLTLATRITNHP